MEIPGWLISFRRNASVRSFGHWLEHGSKRLIHVILRFVIRPPEPADPACLHDVRRILLLRPNFRIGNTLISAPLLAAFREGFPSARLDYLGADTTAMLLRNMPLDNFYAMSRSFIFLPWLYLKTLKHLRDQKYDLVVQVGSGSFSGMIYMGVLGARYRMGAGQWSDLVCNIMVDMTESHHAYDDPVVYAGKLGLNCRNRPAYVTSQQERDGAVSRLSGLGLVDGGRTIPFIALFVGGHKDKRWPSEYWEMLVTRMQQACPGARMVILLGPEELELGARMRALPAFKNIPVLDPFPLREFAALLQQARLIVTPDTGPMHLAVALDVPTIAVLQAKASLWYAPRGDQDSVLFRPIVEQVFECISKHKAWSDVCRG